MLKKVVWSVVLWNDVPKSYMCELWSRLVSDDTDCVVKYSEHYNCICLIVLITLKMATWVAETCRWLLYNKMTFIHLSSFFFGGGGGVILMNLMHKRWNVSYWEVQSLWLQYKRDRHGILKGPKYAPWMSKQKNRPCILRSVQGSKTVRCNAMEIQRQKCVCL